MKSYYLKVLPEMGRGLFADSLGIKQGKLVTRCEILTLDQFDTVLVNQTSLKHYTFKLDNNADCLVLGDGEIFNHSDNPNVGYQLQDFDGRKIMIFFSLRDIKPDEQLVIDYNADIKVNTNDYIKAKSLL